jgi:hypothetical protein
MVGHRAVTHIEKIEMAANADRTLPGFTDSPMTPYKHVFFGAQRDWPNDEVGWTRVPATKNIYKTIDGETVRIAVRVNRRDINRYEKKQAGWNLA